MGNRIGIPSDWFKNTDRCSIEGSITSILIRRKLVRDLLPFTLSDGSVFDTKTFWSTAHGFEQFIFLYMIGAYIKLHGFHIKALQNKWCWRGILVVLIGLWFAISAGAGIKGLTYQSAELIGDVTKYFPIFSVLISSALLVVALGIKPFHCKFINLISGSVLAVYLIHDNPLVREFIWWTISPNIDLIGSNHIFVHMIQKVLFVFVTCVVIDQIRIWLIEKPIEKGVTKWKK